MFVRTLAFGILSLAASVLPLTAANLLPEWTGRDAEDVLVLRLPDQIDTQRVPNPGFRFLILELDPAWSPQWQQAAFSMKNLIVRLRGEGRDVRVGIRASNAQLDDMMAYEMAAYIDGYLFSEEPYIPEGDQTGKLWQETAAKGAEVLTTLLDAASIGIELVLFETELRDADHRAFLSRIAETDTGSLDLQPEITNFPAGNAHFFFDPGSGNHHLAIYAEQGQRQFLSFSLAEGVRVSALYPEEVAFEARQYGRRTELDLSGARRHYFFLLESDAAIAQSERLEIRGQKVIDPYELVVANQVFKKREDEKWRTLMVEEEQNYNFQVPGGVSIDLTYRDTLIFRDGQPYERLRREIFFGGAKWRYEKPPELPLIQPEKVQREPLVINLDKTYTYRYRGEDTIDGFRCWKVSFAPTESDGSFYSGTVWIDQESGAHRRVSAVQSGLEAPVTGNEITAYYDWVEDEGTRYWTQVRETALQLLDVAGERISLQIVSERSDWRFNRDADVTRTVADAYASNMTILRDTDEGLRYLVKKGGERVVSNKDFTRARGIPGGILRSDDQTIPLAGYNHTDLDFMNTGWQANFFVAGAVNDLILSNPDFLGRGWDLTAELFLTAFYGEDSVYQDDEEIEELTVEQLRQSFNLTLGIPINTFWKVDLNYALGYRDYQEGEEMNRVLEGQTAPLDPFVLPSSHLEHTARVSFLFSWKRFTSELQYRISERSDWDPFGLTSAPEPLFDKYAKLDFDASASKRLGSFKQIEGEFSYLKGWDLDRFSRFDFGFFGNSVAGFGSSGIEADEAFLGSIEYEFGVGDLFQFDLSLEAAQAIINDLDNVRTPAAQLDDVFFYGVGLGANFVGPWRTIARINVGYGIDADIEAEAGDWNGQIVFIKLF